MGNLGLKRGPVNLGTLNSIPDELLFYITEYINLLDLESIRLVSRNFKRMSSTIKFRDAYWKTHVSSVAKPSDITFPLKLLRERKIVKNGVLDLIHHSLDLLAIKVLSEGLKCSNYHPDYYPNYPGQVALKAVASGLLNVVVAICDAYPSLNLTDLLSQATTDGKIEVVRYLLVEKSVDPNKIPTSGWTAIFSAIKHNYTEIAALLLELGSDPFRNPSPADAQYAPLYVACQYGVTAIVELLLDKYGVDPRDTNQDYNGFSPLYIACANGHVDIVKLFLDKFTGTGNRSECYKKLDRSGDRSTSLHVACQYGYTPIIKIIIDRCGIDPNGDISRRNVRITALYIVCRNRHIEAADLLLSRGSNPNGPKWDGVNPFYAACLSKDLDMVKLFVLKYRVDPNNRIHHRGGKSPFHVLCEIGCYDIVRFLIEEGKVDPSDEDHVFEGVSPIERAKNNKHYNVVELLEEATV